MADSACNHSLARASLSRGPLFFRKVESAMNVRQRSNRQRMFVEGRTGDESLSKFKSSMKVTGRIVDESLGQVESRQKFGEGQIGDERLSRVESSTKIFRTWNCRGKVVAGRIGDESLAKVTSAMKVCHRSNSP
jgi:hypothetical protein